MVEVALARFGQIDVLVNTIGAFDGNQPPRSRLVRAPDLFTLNALSRRQLRCGSPSTSGATTTWTMRRAIGSS